MRKRGSRIFVILIGISGVLASQQARHPGWKGTITDESGIQVVRNPSEPLYGEFSFDLKEDFRLGGDPEKEAYYFPKGAVLSVGQEGDLLVADYGNRRVQMFDNEGVYIRTIGRQGQGPGEYMFPGGAHFDADGNIWVDGGRQIVVFSKDGNFVRNVPLITRTLMRKILRPGGSLIGTLQPQLASDGPKLELVKIEADGKASRTIAEFRNELSQAKEAIAFHHYSTWIVFASVSADAVAYGFSGDYKIFFADSEGKVSLILTKAEKLQAISDAEKDETREKGLFFQAGSNQKGMGVFFPDHRPCFAQFLADDAGRLYVLRVKSILDKDALTSVDVFSREGIYLYRMVWTVRPAAIRSGYLYDVREDPETNEYLVVRQKIMNWEAMKSR
jgi:hypothetical protein